MQSHLKNYSSIQNIALFLFLLLLPSEGMTAGKTIGVIMTENIAYYKEIHKTFAESLPAEDFGPGNAEIVLQSPNAESMSWTNAARKLVAVGADVIIAYGAPATLAALHETTDIPIIFAGVYDPLSVGIAGANTTGISSKEPIASLLKNFKSISNFASLGVVFSDSEKDSVMQANEVKQLEGGLGFRSVLFNVKKAEDSSKIANVDALLLTTGCATIYCVNKIISLARKVKIPTASTIDSGDNSGVILTISANPSEQGREAARLASRVMKGAKPSSLPMEWPKKIDMIINLKEATSLGLKIPFDLLTSATKVIK